ncbi:helix-turn-helix domain-containing protein [Klenkia sp. PcliD-1-E]|uniref:helix-turn-helix domain-containing protein n=1 Tax=Klenkia sp. PcliD-1-E TaxID=2954492 RepID=UPI0035ABC3E6
MSADEQMPNLSRDQLLLTTEEAADVLRIGRTTVYALIKDGHLRPVHIGRSCRISRAELERYVRRLDNPAPLPRRRPRVHPPVDQAPLFTVVLATRDRPDHTAPTEHRSE